MNKILSLITLFLFINCSGFAQKKEAINDNKYPIKKTEKEWRNQLTSIQYYVLREAGTERAFTSSLNDNKEKGVYVCAGCNTPLYKSEHKYDSGSGWPSFDRAIVKSVDIDVDYKIGYARTELKCASCGGHLGHSFDDGPVNTTGKRHCINGAALIFKEKKFQKKN